MLGSRLCWVELVWVGLGGLRCEGVWVCEGVWGWGAPQETQAINGVPFKSLYQDYGGKIGKMADFGEFHPGTKPLP